MSVLEIALCIIGWFGELATAVKIMLLRVYSVDARIASPVHMALSTFFAVDIFMHAFVPPVIEKQPGDDMKNCLSHPVSRWTAGRFDSGLVFWSLLSTVDLPSLNVPIPNRAAEILFDLQCCTGGSFFLWALWSSPRLHALLRQPTHIRYQRSAGKAGMKTGDTATRRGIWSGQIQRHSCSRNWMLGALLMSPPK